MSQVSRSQDPRPVEPVPYAGVVVPSDALPTGSASWAVLVGAIVLRLIGAYTLVECRRPLAYVLQDVYDNWGHIDFGIGLMAYLIVAAYVAWGLLLVLRGPRFLGGLMRRAAAGWAVDGAEWSVVALSAGGAIVILWAMEPLLSLFSVREVVGGVPAALGQLALGIWLFVASGRLSATRLPGDRR